MGSQIPLQVSDSIAIICRAAFGFKYHCDIDIQNTKSLDV